jgi:hypothetical protein
MTTNILVKFLILGFVLIYSQHSFSEVTFDQQPMYADLDRDSSPEYISQDNDLIAKATRTFGTREHASEGYTEKGFDHYSNNEFDKSMKRFNQAWLLNPENPYPYLGFGLLMNVNKQSCKTYEMFKLANDKGLNENGFLADYAYASSQCALMKDESEQLELFNISNKLHEQASKTSSKRVLAYVYHSWAKSFFLQKEFNKTDELIELSKSLGGEIDKSLLKAMENHSKQ